MISLPRAATVLLVRESPQGLLVYLVQRHRAHAFFGGAHVFVGGRVDLKDEEWGARLLPHTPPHEAPLLVAAARELFEEAGVLLVSAEVSPAALQSLRGEMLAGKLSFLEVLQELGVDLDLRQVIPWAHWITPSSEPKRFDTHFFVAHLPEGQVPGVDEREVVAELWASPREALDAHLHRNIVLPPPTYRNLELLADEITAAKAATFAALQEHLARWPVLPILPKIVQTPEGREILLPWDPDYPEAPGDSLQPLPSYPREWRQGPSRMVMREGRWVTR